MNTLKYGTVITLTDGWEPNTVDVVTDIHKGARSHQWYQTIKNTTIFNSKLYINKEIKL